MAAMEATGILHESFGETDLLARISVERFGAIALFETAEEARQKLNFARAKLRRLSTARVATAVSRVRSGASLEDLIGQAEQALCENRLVASSAGRHL
jgi:GGDEF domain-containing protein